VVLEGLQQLFQPQQNSLRYSATAEAHKHEMFRYLSHAGPYRDAPAPEAVLAELVEGLVSQSTPPGRARPGTSATRSTRG
jgi:hypothetical protein